jgi:glucose-1-phosphatase
MPPPQAIVFDLGKVLVDFDYGRSAANLAAHATAPAEAIHRILDQTPLLHEYETGLMTTAQFREQVGGAIGFKGSPEQFASLFADMFTPIREMIALHEELIGRGLATFAFSNTNELAIQFIRRTFSFFDRFTGTVLSYEEGFMKPTDRIYAVVENRTWRRGADLLYIDDRLENVEQARDRGWRTIHHKDPKTTVEQVRANLD